MNTSLEGILIGLVPTVVGLIVGLGAMSPASGGEIVAAAGTAIGAVFSILHLLHVKIGASK